MKNKIFLIFMFAMTTCFWLNAQETKQTTIPFENGSLTFSYYEKDGVKIPHGTMAFSQDNYSEKGENKDGYKQGEWTVTVKIGKSIQKNVFNYKDGLLEGRTTFSSLKIDPKTNKEILEEEETFNFHMGHLYGENKVVISGDTLYCNFDEKGNRVGTWKRINPNKTEVAVYSADSETPIESYELDVLGNKKDSMAPIFHNMATLKLISFDSFKIKEIPFSLHKQRPELPSLSNVKYGYHSASKPIPNDN